MTTPTRVSGFSPAATQFFEDLEDQNTREFWLAHKDVFEREVREPMAALLDSLPAEYQPFKVFRMNRDIRFSADKSPYKTMHGAAHGVPGAVHYLHLDASGLMVACGSYMMPPDELERYREAVAADSSGEELSEILAELGRRRSVQRESRRGRAAEDRAARLPARPSASRPAATEGRDRHADSSWLGACRTGPTPLLRHRDLPDVCGSHRLAEALRGRGCLVAAGYRRHPTLRGMFTLYMACMPCTA